MNHILQKRLAASILKCSRNRVKFKEDQVKRIMLKKTRKDLRYEINRGNIHEEKIINQVRHKFKKGRRGLGSIKGKKVKYNKLLWIKKIRAQRRALKEVRGSCSKETYKEAYKKIKGNYFENKTSVKTFVANKSEKLKNEEN